MITYINYSERDNTIYFDITEHHYRDIASVSLDNYSVKYLMDNEYVDERNISLSTNGLYVFSEDKTGIFNLYGLNQSDSSSGYITNTLGGAFMPDISKKNQLLEPFITVSTAKLLEEMYRESLVTELIWDNKIDYEINNEIRQEDFKKISFLNLIKKYFSKKIRTLFKK